MLASLANFSENIFENSEVKSNTSEEESFSLFFTFNTTCYIHIHIDDFLIYKLFVSKRLKKSCSDFS